MGCRETLNHLVSWGMHGYDFSNASLKIITDVVDDDDL